MTYAAWTKAEPGEVGLATFTSFGLSPPIRKQLKGVGMLVGCR